MENNLILSLRSIDEVWELPDNLVLKLEEYKTEHPIAPDHSNTDEIYLGWYDTLTPQEQQAIKKNKAEPPSA